MWTLSVDRCPHVPSRCALIYYVRLSGLGCGLRFFFNYIWLASDWQCHLKEFTLRNRRFIIRFDFYGTSFWILPSIVNIHNDVLSAITTVDQNVFIQKPCVVLEVCVNLVNHIHFTLFNIVIAVRISLCLGFHLTDWSTDCYFVILVYYLLDVKRSKFKLSPLVSSDRVLSS